jgi:hypothetical protein
MRVGECGMEPGVSLLSGDGMLRGWMVDRALLAVKVKIDRAPRPSALDGGELDGQACAYQQCHKTTKSVL